MTDGSPAARATLVNWLLLGSVVWLAAGTPVAARLAMNELPPLSTGFVRFALAGAMLAITHALVLRRGEPQAPIERRDFPRLLLAAVLCVPVNQACFLLGVKLAGASHAGLFYALNPVLTYIMTLLLGQVAFSRRMAGATLLAFAGAGMLALDGLGAARGGWAVLGDGLLLAAVTSWAAFTLAVLPMGRKYGTVRVLRLVLLLGAALYSPALLIDGMTISPSSYSWSALGGFAYITVGTAYLNYLLWMIVITRIDVNRASVAVNCAPILAVMLAHLILDEPITRWLALGAVLVVIAIGLANWDAIRRWRRPREA